MRTSLRAYEPQRVQASGRTNPSAYKPHGALATPRDLLPAEL
jgi:hypothetical protein